jgi:hypothetical protein
MEARMDCYEIKRFASFLNRAGIFLVLELSVPLRDWSSSDFGTQQVSPSIH